MSNKMTYNLSWGKNGIESSTSVDYDISFREKLYDYFSDVYKKLDLTYPKFYKMSNLAKLGFLATEILKKEQDLSIYNEDEIALVFQNSYSSLDTDEKHHEKVNEANAHPSPSIFVYTLPNIMLGEIAIRNQWFGENLFVLAEAFDIDDWKRTAESLIEMNKAKAVIGGWVDLYKDDFELKLYLLEKD